MRLTCYHTNDLQNLDNKEKLYALIAEADEALYKAKDAGRNCIMISKNDLNSSNNKTGNEVELIKNSHCRYYFIAANLAQTAL